MPTYRDASHLKITYQIKEEIKCPSIIDCIKSLSGFLFFTIVSNSNIKRILEKIPLES